MLNKELNSQNGLYHLNPNTEMWMKNGFKSYNDYLEHYNFWNKKGKSRLFKKLFILKENLEKEFWNFIDPILYLANLYYWEKLSVADTFKRVAKKWMNYSSSDSFEKTFTWTFWWTLRDTSWTHITRKKTQNKKKQLQEDYKKYIKEKYKKIQRYISDNVYKILSRKNNNFERIHYLNLKNNLERIVYVLEIFLWLKKEDIIEINKLWPWARVIANYLDKRFKIYAKNYCLELTIFPKYIQTIINENKK